MKCTACKKERGAVFRTNPLGQENAGWMCQPCIAKHHDTSLIDPETQEIANILTQPQMITGFTSQGIDFGHAVAAAKKGKRIARAGWNGKSMFVFVRPADELEVGFIIDKVKSLPQSVKDFFAKKDALQHPSEQGLDKVKFSPYFCMYAADGSIVNGWLASQTDMLATDWTVLD